MSSIEETLVSIIQNDTSLAASVGSRVYPGRLPEGLSMAADSPDLPALAYSLTSEREMYEVPVAYSLIQVSVFGRTYSEVKQVAKEVRLAFHRYKGGIVMGGTFVNELDLTDPTTGLPYCPVDIRLAYKTE